jgi:hypothetical protein
MDEIGNLMTGPASAGWAAIIAAVIVLALAHFPLAIPALVTAPGIMAIAAGFHWSFSPIESFFPRVSHFFPTSGMTSE